MLRNFKLVIEYDGSAYHGWQRQKADRTIQGEIENAIATMTGSQVSLTGSGRTDAGVHALGQTANFVCDTVLGPEVFRKGLTSLLDDDIAILSCEEVAIRFHARQDVKSKTYQYHILNRPIPKAIGRQYAWHIRKTLDFEAMRSALKHIVGTHDFKAFEGVGSPRAHTVRTVFVCDLTHAGPDELVLEITGNGFLRFMVRNIVGTLAEVGLGKRNPDDFKRILDTRDRAQAGFTAPSQGLFLMRVEY